MTTPARHVVYRACINLYPSSFRRHYREDLVQHFDDLVVDRGLRVASLRTALDLVITLPTYRLERIMSQPRSALRRRRLTTSAVLSVVFVVSSVIYTLTIGDTWSPLATVLTGVGTLAMIGALVFLVVGLFTPKVDPLLVP